VPRIMIQKFGGNHQPPAGRYSIRPQARRPQAADKLREAVKPTLRINSATNAPTASICRRSGHLRAEGSCQAPSEKPQIARSPATTRPIHETVMDTE
jgi:hypothetical protein